MQRLGLIIIIICALCACARKATVCGVPVQGTPWELAAAIHDEGDGTFVPEAVEYIGTTKAIIIGWSLPAEQPDTIFCDVVEGKVVAAHLFTEE